MGRKRTGQANQAQAAPPPGELAVPSQGHSKARKTGRRKSGREQLLAGSSGTVVTYGYSKRHGWTPVKSVPGKR